MRCPLSASTIAPSRSSGPRLRFHLVWPLAGEARGELVWAASAEAAEEGRSLLSVSLRVGASHADARGRVLAAWQLLAPLVEDETRRILAGVAANAEQVAEESLAQHQRRRDTQGRRAMASPKTSLPSPTPSEPGRRERGAAFLVARFRAPDYARMKRAFDELQSVRERHGARGHRIFRLADDPRDYMVIIEFASFGGAQGFTDDPALVGAIDALGVEGGAHHVQYVEEFREQLEAVDYTW
jgi:hypothetical protein